MQPWFRIIGSAAAISVIGSWGINAAQSMPISPPAILAQAQTQTYNGPQYNYPIKTQYPQTMQVEGGCSGEGCGFSFTLTPQDNDLDNAEVHIFIPRGAKTAAEQEVFVTGPNGLMENNAWQAIADPKAAQQYPYGWVKKVIAFNSEDNESGQILLGEVGGQAVQVMVVYPAAMANQFLPAAKVVLDNLTFATELLPLQPSSEGPGEDPATMCDPSKESC